MWKPLDKIEESQWQSFINELIPRGIAKLFFFDGEKIVEMAQEGNEDVEIKSSFDTLLGLDLVEQLRSDIRVSLSRNLKGDSKKTQEQIELYELFKRLDGKGVFVLLSNSSSEFILDLYKE